MLNAIIRLALQYRFVTIALALVVLVYGGYTLFNLPIDVFPDLNRPRVTIITEAHGLAPEEVETLVSFPLESVLNGATGVEAVRSVSDVGLSVVYVEFDWGTNIYTARQIVAEKIALAADRMPKGVKPQLAPVSSIMGQIMIIGMFSESGATSPTEVRTLADWVVRQRLLTLPGVAQVVTMGGGRLQFQVLVNPESLVKFGVTLQDVEAALGRANNNSTGGYLDVGDNELLVRAIGRVENLQDLESVVVKADRERPVLLGQVARIVEGAQIKRGDSAINGSPAVLLVVTKQPGADTRLLTERIVAAVDDMKGALPKDVRIDPNVYQQRAFIELSIRNVVEALRDGGILVVIILFIFLLNFRTTFITLTAIPLSIVTAGLVFKWFGMSINTMTLGGLAVAVGELVDDAIVDVENIFRRLRENRHAAVKKPALQVIYQASSEVRNSIVFSTILVVLVFVPLFALGGMEGKLFVPLGVAYIVSIIASLVVSLTVTPVLSYWLLPNAKFMAEEKDGLLLRILKRIGGSVIRFSVRHPWPILIAVLAAVGVSGVAVSRMGRDFLPPFDEGTVQVNVMVPPGTSLEASDRIGRMADERLMQVAGVVTVARRTGRAELDEHAMGVNVSEIIVSIDPDSGRTREKILDDVRRQLGDVPGTVVSAEQPLQHLISHMLSGVQAQVAIKLYGDDLATLRRTATAMKNAIADVPGVTDLQVEQQVEIPQLQIQIRRDELARNGLAVDDVNEFIETAMNGRKVSEVLRGQRNFDLVVRLDEEFRENVEYLKRLRINLPTGGGLPLSAVADVIQASGPNTINRENVRRRIVVSCNTTGRDLASIVGDIQQRLAPIQSSLPTGYFVEYSGQFESQQQATRMIGLLSLASLACMFLALYTLFRSVNLALQVLAALPMAAIGAVTALVVTGQSLTVASMVGFISLAGIASRNGILLIAHYLHLVRHEGESFSLEMIERAGKERLAPMLMTALTAGIALIPLVLAAGEPGKEILYPVATVILGGLISSTLLDFFVHPALFRLFGRRDAERSMTSDDEDLGFEN
ncbi:efflux RND transporter permease subunit [Lacipirellula limnantheis]|uniref:Cobalt-zinc-cadmium resistance protein CzcA n=1 Tax=Lacipirellula limnantheis TaxID=2528024 RepID=A0A517U3P9_9BACT|nr:efflux RND transporter permease subunit [Lacipirellula limnantheis]QDT75254.1 Cobalt-zinc-cadmium resistance protein CzcA [Lacipirellula limnantheis]